MMAPSCTSKAPESACRRGPPFRCSRALEKIGADLIAHARKGSRLTASPSAFLGLLLLSMLSGCVHRADVAPKGFEEARSTRAQLESGFAPRRWAVVVGIDRFEDPTFDDLRHAVDDAKEMARVLGDERFGGFDQVVALTSEKQTTRESILFELGRLRNDLRRQDTLVLYFSGHGTIEFTREGMPLLYLVARDTRANDLWGTGIELGALRSFLQDLKPQRKVLILDSCFSGTGKSRVSASTRQRLAQAPNLWRDLSVTMGQSEAILMASTLGGVALEDDKLGHAIYTHFLLEALTEARVEADVNRDGAVSTYEAHDYARVATLEQSEKKQVPEGYFRVVGRAEMYLAGKPDEEKGESAALVYAYNDRTRDGATLEVDGRPKGAFPRTVAIEAGRRKITIRDPGGKTIADGGLNFAPGQVYSVGLLIDEMLGYRRFFGLSSGGSFQVTGPASMLWGDGVPRLSVSSGYRVRGGALRGLSLSFSLGWNPALKGSWTEMELADSSWGRQVFDLSTALVLRRSLWKLHAGVGWFGAATYVPEVGTSSETSGTSATSGDPSSATSSESSSANLADYYASQPWLIFSGGPVIWFGYGLSRNLLLTLETRGALHWGDFAEPGSKEFNLEAATTLGVEVGF